MTFSTKFDTGIASASLYITSVSVHTVSCIWPGVRPGAFQYPKACWISAADPGRIWDNLLARPINFNPSMTRVARNMEFWRLVPPKITVVPAFFQNTPPPIKRWPGVPCPSAQRLTEPYFNIRENKNGKVAALPARKWKRKCKWPLLDSETVIASPGKYHSSWATVYMTLEPLVDFHWISNNCTRRPSTPGHQLRTCVWMATCHRLSQVIATCIPSDGSTLLARLQAAK